MKTAKGMQGFTLVEAAVSLWLLLTLLCLVLPMVERSMERRAMEELVAVYMADYMYAQSLAITRGEETMIQFVPPEYYYTVKIGRTTVKKVPYNRRIWVESSYNLPFPHGVRFDARGYVHMGGTLVLYGKYETRRLIIQLVTGRIRVESL